MKGRKPDQAAIRRGANPDLVRHTDARGVTMPPSIAADPVKSEIWQQLAPPQNNFTEQDVPALKLLCMWHAVADEAERMLSRAGGGVEILTPSGKVMETPTGEVPVLKKAPALQALKEASTEIRALSDMMGLSPLARTRIGLMAATTVKTAADTAAMFRSIDSAYEIDGEVVE